MRTYTKDQLSRTHWTKRDLAKHIGLSGKTFDFALPQEWLNNFIKKTGLDYHLVAGTTFSYYPDGYAFPTIISGCTEVQEYLNTELNKVKS